MPLEAIHARGESAVLEQLRTNSLLWMHEIIEISRMSIPAVVLSSCYASRLFRFW